VDGEGSVAENGEKRKGGRVKGWGDERMSKVTEQMRAKREMHTARILEVGLAWTASLGQGADIGENDDRGTVVVDAAVACCGLLTRRREMGVLATRAGRARTFRGGRSDTRGRLGGCLCGGRCGGKLEDGLCGTNKVDRGSRCVCMCVCLRLSLRSRSRLRLRLVRLWLGFREWHTIAVWYGYGYGYGGRLK